MKSTFQRTGVLAFLAAGALLVGCSDNVENAPQALEQSNATLASVLSDRSELTTLSRALRDTGLVTVFDGPASYTILAPSDSAFDELGDKGESLFATDRRAILAAVLRNHIVPGQLDPDSIRAAIVAKGGPVEMTTLGNTIVRFAIDDDDDTLTVTGDGPTAVIASESATVGSNGIVLPIDKLLSETGDEASQ